MALRIFVKGQTPKTVTTREAQNAVVEAAKADIPVKADEAAMKDLLQITKLKEGPSAEQVRAVVDILDEAQRAAEDLRTEKRAKRKKT